MSPPTPEPAAASASRPSRSDRPPSPAARRQPPEPAGRPDSLRPPGLAARRQPAARRESENCVIESVVRQRPAVTAAAAAAAAVTDHVQTVRL